MNPTAAPSGLARRLVIAAAVAAVLAVIVFLLAVHTVLGQRFDNAALLGSRSQGSGTRLGDISLLRRITVDSFIGALLLIVVLGLVRRRPRLGIGLAIAAAIAVVLTHVLRTGVLHRPFLVHSDTLYSANTFPSGHTAIALACALALVVVSPPAWRGISAVLAGSYAWITAAAVQTAGWHRPSDAIGAALLTFAVIALVTAAGAAWRPIGSAPRYGHLPAFAVLGVVWVVAGTLSVLNAARVLRFLADHADSFNPTQSVLNDAYLCSVNLTVVVVVTLLAALLILLGPADLDQPSTR